MNATDVPDTEALNLEWYIGPDMYDHLPPDVLDADGQPDEQKVRAAVLAGVQAQRERYAGCEARIAAGDQKLIRALARQVKADPTRFPLPINRSVPLGQSVRDGIIARAAAGRLWGTLIDRVLPRGEAERILIYVQLVKWEPRDFTPRSLPPLVEPETIPLISIPDDPERDAVRGIRALADDGNEVYVTDLTLFGCFGDSATRMAAALGPEYNIRPRRQRGYDAAGNEVPGGIENGYFVTRAV